MLFLEIRIHFSFQRLWESKEPFVDDMSYLDMMRDMVIMSVLSGEHWCVPDMTLVFEFIKRSVVSTKKNWYEIMKGAQDNEKVLQKRTTRSLKQRHQILLNNWQPCCQRYSLTFGLSVVNTRSTASDHSRRQHHQEFTDTKTAFVTLNQE